MLSNTNHQLDTEQSLCPFKMVTGFPCPGCGITKSIVYCYEGNFAKSSSFHVLGPFVVVFCIFLLVLLPYEISTEKEYFNGILYNRKLAYGFAFFLITYHLIRIVLFIQNNSWESILKQSIWN